MHDVAVQHLPVRFAIDRAGLVGADGPTHAGSFDVAYLTCLPGFVVMAAGDEAELKHMVATAAAIDDRPCAFRYPRGEGWASTCRKRGQPLALGRGRESSARARRWRCSHSAARLAECLKAADQLAGVGLSADRCGCAFRQAARPRSVRQLAAITRC